MKKYIVCTVTALFLILAAIPLHTLPKKEIVIATGEYYPYATQKTQGKGIVPEITTEVLKNMGYSVTYEFMPWTRCEKMVEIGKVWAALPYAKNSQREKKYDFSGSIVESRVLFFYYNKPEFQNLSISSYSDLKQYKIGAVKGYYYDSLLTNAGLKLVYAYKEETNIQHLVTGQIDLYPAEEMVALSYINTLYPEKKKNFGTLQHVIKNEGLHLMISRSFPGSRKLTKQFDVELEKIKNSGFITTVKASYGL